MLTPATSATPLVVRPAHPRVAKMRAVASRIAATVSRDLPCFGAFLMFPGCVGMRVVTKEPPLTKYKHNARISGITMWRVRNRPDGQRQAASHAVSFGVLSGGDWGAGSVRGDRMACV